MINVCYVKFYQPVKIGKDQFTHLLADAMKRLGVEVTFSQGTLCIDSGKPVKKYVGLANIIEFDGADSTPTVERLKPGPKPKST